MSHEPLSDKHYDEAGDRQWLRNECKSLAAEVRDLRVANSQLSAKRAIERSILAKLSPEDAAARRIVELEQAMALQWAWIGNLHTAIAVLKEAEQKP